MMKHELVERLLALKVTLQGDTIGDEDYRILEEWYLFLDLEKDIFASVVKAVGIETLLARHWHPKEGNIAMKERRKREDYKRDKKRLEEMQLEVSRLSESVRKFEKSQIY